MNVTLGATTLRGFDTEWSEVFSDENILENVCAN